MGGWTYYLEDRIIPARAGFTARWFLFLRTRRDHPRSRGVYRIGMVLLIQMCGSSPLARGLPFTNIFPVLSVRIIPARAGFTSTVPANWKSSRDHPRSRGVYGIMSDNITRNQGSSPLARGLQRVGAVDRVAGRIIPARAGFTDASGLYQAGITDHPRSRGVYPRVSSRESRRGGSSPLARGLHKDISGSAKKFGIIPARAGFTRSTR